MKKENSKRQNTRLFLKAFLMGNWHGNIRLIEYEIDSESKKRGNYYLTRKLCIEKLNQWSDGMISFLCGMNKQRKELLAQGADAMSAEMIADYEGKYFSRLK